MKEYLEITHDIDTTINIIKNIIATNTPFALSRYGDGEINLINKNSSIEHQIRKCKDWDYVYPDEVELMYTHANQILMNAIRYSDIISIMDKGNDIAKLINYKEHKWSIKTSVLEANQIDVSNLKITDHMLSRDIRFGKPENFKDILQGRSLNIISPNTEKLKTKNLGKLLDSDVTFTHHPYSVNFKNRNDFMKEFSRIKSDVVLVGTGNIKDYVVYLKHNYGKVAIDAGAMLDAWAGIRSRPWFHKGGKQEYLVL